MPKLFRHLLAAALLACAGAAGAAPYASLFVFGDSLSDPGNAQALSGGFGGQFPPNYGYPLPITRFTNGPTAAEALAAGLGVADGAAYSSAGGTNYAVGGALAGTGNFNWIDNRPAGVQAALPALRDTGANAQVARFAAAAPAFDPSGSLFMVWVGANDFFLWSVNGTPQSLVPTAQAAAASVRGAIDSLYDLGARRFLVLDLPDLGAVPGVNTDPRGVAAGGAYTGVFNATLDALVAQAAATRPGIDINAFAVSSLFDSIVATPGAFGFSDVTTACVASPAAVLAGCAGFLFWDAVHPTAATHALLASSLVGAVVPVPGVLALLLAALVPMMIGQRPSRAR